MGRSRKRKPKRQRIRKTQAQKDIRYVCPKCEKKYKIYVAEWIRKLCTVSPNKKCSTCGESKDLVSVHRNVLEAAVFSKK